ncbi:actin nucleation-promoting factor WAS isoform X2 [Conger conger]|uniref:actin nucleation-promoting factor WAS isoform X2 n=1 Tax=Conger conger TaxID=82655 RepID=UPI002A599436|nr:actin nucleation-promoting factor WAS isoform X2 [Conger conger]
MDVDTEQVMEHTEKHQVSTEEDISNSKARGRGFKGHGRGGWVGRGGRGGRGMMMKGYGPLGRSRGRGRAGAMNGFGPGRRGMGRMRPYPDLRGPRGGMGGPMRMGPPPPPPPMHMRGPYPPMHRHGPLPPPPPGHPGFRGRPPHPRGRGMHPGPHRPFHPRGVI